uniref:RNA-directed RNA polymerase L n=2 Tax=Halophytophthora RNA virus 3 TaxID=2717545 RepID=A0A7D5KED1_9VIRU|nr:RNA-dependent RNA polymerase [Halophytophthora RNA virus 3]
MLPVDLGGDGDCFYRCMHYALGRELGCNYQEFKELFWIKNWVDTKEVSQFCEMVPVKIFVWKRARDLAGSGSTMFPKRMVPAGQFGVSGYLHVDLLLSDGHYLFLRSSLKGPFKSKLLGEDTYSSGSCLNDFISKSVASLGDNPCRNLEILSRVQLNCPGLMNINSTKPKELEMFSSMLGVQSNHNRYLLQHPECVKIVEDTVFNLKQGFLGGSKCFKGSLNLRQLASLYPLIQEQTYDMDSVLCLINNFRMFTYNLAKLAEDYYNGTLVDRSLFPQVIKDYFKFRHDLLFFIFFMSMFEDGGKIDTDVPFRKFKVDSDKTPDYIYEGMECCYVFENSVSNDMMKSSFQKGKDLKTSVYRNELDQLAQATGKEVVYIPVFFETKTNTHNWNECWSKMKDFSLFTDRSETLLSFLVESVPNLRLLDRYNFMSFTGSDVVLSEKITSISSKLLGEIESCGIIKKGSINQTYSALVNKTAISSFNKYVGKIKEELSYRRMDRKYRIVLMPNRVKLYQSEDGLRPTRWMKFIDNDMMVQFYRNVHFSTSGKEQSPVNFQPCETVTQTWVAPDYQETQDHEHAIDLPSVDYDENCDAEAYVYSLENDEFHYNAEKEIGLSTYNMCGEMVVEAENVIKKKLVENMAEIRDVRPQNPFTLPFVCTSSLEPGTISTSKVRFTDKVAVAIMEKVNSGNFSRDYKLPSELLEKKATIHKEVRKIQYDHRVDGKIMPFKSIRGDLRRDEVETFKTMAMCDREINNERRKLIASEDKSKVTMSSDFMKSYGKPENFRDSTKKGVIRGIDHNYSESSEIFVRKAINYMSGKAEGTMPDHVMDVGVDTIEMTKLKDVMMANHSKAHDLFKSLNVANMSDFVQRFAYTLLYFSQKKANGNQYMVSNLGFKNVMLIVKGGKKIWNTQKTRVFKLYYPAPMFFKDHRELFSTSTVLHEVAGELYVETSWSTLEEKVLEDKSFFQYKVMSQFVNCTVRNKHFLDGRVEDYDVKKIMWNILLSFNNRRSTESNLGALRNLLANCLGDFTNYVELAQEFDYVPADAIQLHIINSLSSKLHKFYMSINNDIDKNFKEQTTGHLFVDSKLVDENDFTHLLYSTYGMTKAPYNQKVEQARNLAKMMKAHVTFQESVNTNKHVEFFEKTNAEGWGCFNHDFNVNYRYAFHMGTIMSGIIKSNNAVPELHAKWLKIMGLPFTSIIKSSGLRGTPNEAGFFGRKAPEVVGEELINHYQQRLKKDNKISKIVKKEDETSLQKFGKLLDEENVTMLDMVNTYGGDDQKFVFHEVDKTQRHGGREIYVMSMETKTFCWPLEQFFHYLCTFLDNELISIPSNKRLYTIHSRLFERSVQREQVKYFLTLDCRRWGPMSVFLKYTYMILGTAEVLPKSLVQLMLYVTKKYFEKEIYISPKSFEVFIKNAKNKKYASFFKDLDTCPHFNMPYSFIMGIFNYLSSMMHALNQIDATRRICKRINRDNDANFSFYMDAHSDDSGGYMMLANNKDKKAIVRSAIQEYEYWLKQLNHMLSVKKCVVSPKYFELLSILYVNNRLLPVVPKFFSNLEFKPTLEGYSSDMAQSYSKCIELVTMGATFSEAYYSMRLYSEMVRRFYHVEFTSEKPINCYGGAFAHPVTVLMVWCNGDSCRLYKVDPVLFNRYQTAIKALTYTDHDSFISNGLKPKIVIKPTSSQITLANNAQSLFGIFVDDEIFRNVNFKHSLLYLASFYHLMKKSSYVASLNYITNTRRVTRIFHTQKAPCINIFGLNLSIKESQVLIENFVHGVSDKIGGQTSSLVKLIEENSSKVDDKKQELMYDFLLGEANHIYDYISNTVTEDVRLERTHTTCKPCTVDMSLSPINVNLSTGLDEIYYYGTPNYCLFGKKKDLSRDKQHCHRALDMIGAEYDTYEKFMFYMRKLQKYECNYHMYSYVSSDNRAIKNYLDVFSMIETNSVFGNKMTRIYSNISGSYKDQLLATKIDKDTRNELKLCKIRSLVPRKFNLKHPDWEPSRRLAKGFADGIKQLARKNPLQIDNFYVWLNRSKKLSSHWFGSAKCLLMLEGVLICLLIESGYLVGIETDDLDSLDSYIVQHLLTFVDSSEIKMKRSVADYTRDYGLGFIEGVVKFGMEKDMDSIYCKCLSYSRDYYNMLRRDRFAVGDKFTLKCLTSLYSVKLLYNEVMFNKDDVKNFNLTADEMSKLGYKHFHVVESSHIDKFSLVENLTHTEMYAKLIYKKLNKNEPLISRLKKLEKYEPLEKQLLENLLNKNVNPDNIPDTAYEVLAQQMEEDLTDSRMNEILSELCSTTDEQQLQNFVAKWGISQGNVLKLYDQSLNAKMFENPEILSLNYPEFVVPAVDVLYKAVTTSFDQPLITKFNKVYIDQKLYIKPNDINRLLTQMIWNNDSMKHQLDPYHKYVKKIFLCIFEDKRALIKFKEQIQVNVLLKSLPISSDMSENWARLLYKLTLGKSPSPYVSWDQIYKDYQLRAKGERGTRQLRFNVSHVGKIPRFHVHPIAVKLQEQGPKAVVHYKPKNTVPKITKKCRLFSCFEPEVLDYDQMLENEEIDDFIDDSFADKPAGREVYMEYKEDYEIETYYFKHDLKWDKAMHKGDKLEKHIDLPVFNIIGMAGLDFLSTTAPFFVLVTDTIPSDLKLQPKGRVKCYYCEEEVFQLTRFVFAYNLPYELNGMRKFDVDTYLLNNPKSANPKFNYYVDGEICINDGGLDADYLYRRYMTSAKSEMTDQSFKEGTSYEAKTSAAKGKGGIKTKVAYNSILEKLVESYCKGSIDISVTSEHLRAMGFKIDTDFLKKLPSMVRPLRCYFIDSIKHKLGMEGAIYKSLTAVDIGAMVTNVDLMDSGYKENIAFSFRNNYVHELNDYNPLAEESTLAGEIKVTFGEFAGRVMNRPMRLSKVSKVRVRHKLNGLKSDFKMMQSEAEMEQIRKYKKYILFIDFLLDIANNAHEIESGNDIDMFDALYSEFLSKYETFLDSGSSEEVEYLEPDNPDFYFNATIA